MVQRLCLQHNCNSHFKLKLKQKYNFVPTLSTSYIFHKIDKLKCQNKNKLNQFKSHYIANKRAQRALGRSPEEKVKGDSGVNNRERQGHNLKNFSRGPFDDVIY